MPSNYVAFEVITEDAAGNKATLPLTTVAVRNVTGAVNLSNLTTDANGHIPAGSLSVNPGTLIRFSVDLGDGRKGFSEQTTT